MTTYAELRALAEAAEPHLIPRHPSSGGCSGCRLTEALDPQSILALLDDLDAAQAALATAPLAVGAMSAIAEAREEALDAAQAAVRALAEALTNAESFPLAHDRARAGLALVRHSPAIAAAREGAPK